MKCKIEIDMNSAAFVDNPFELADILRGFTGLHNFDHNPSVMLIRDGNGNTVGRMEITTENPIKFV